MKHILILTSTKPRREDAISFLREACSEAARRRGEEVTIESALDVKGTTTSIQEKIGDADFILADVSGTRQDVMYQLGFAHASLKPTILVSDDRGKPVLYELKAIYIHLYKTTGRDPAFVERLVKNIAMALQKPDNFKIDTSQSIGLAESPTVFVSYSHADQQCLDRLRVHLRPLQREKAIDYWDDRTIQAGELWRNQIEEALSKARIAILMISADFLASDFVVESELPTLLAAAQRKGTTILPVILKPCGFLRDERLSAFQSINDPGRPLLGLSDAEQEAIYARIAERIENELRARE